MRILEGILLTHAKRRVGSIQCPATSLLPGPAAEDRNIPVLGTSYESEPNSLCPATMPAMSVITKTPRKR